MVDDQAVLAFLQHLDLVLSAALRGDEQQRLRRLTMTHALVMALLADHRNWTRHSGRRLLASPSWIPDAVLEGIQLPVAVPMVLWTWSSPGAMALADSNCNLLFRR
jgi:hypothetical protein